MRQLTIEFTITRKQFNAVFRRFTGYEKQPVFGFRRFIVGDFTHDISPDLHTQENVFVSFDASIKYFIYTPSPAQIPTSFHLSKSKSK